jgi:hypothetical protein
MKIDQESINAASETMAKAAQGEPVSEVPDVKSHAQQALERCDAAELFALYEKSVKEIGEMRFVIDAISRHYIVGSDKQPRYTQRESESAVAAMQSVALAAIDLAKSINQK